MDSGMISKNQKAKMYAEEPERIVFESFQVSLRGEHDKHAVSYDRGSWNCTCRFFGTHGVCSHTMALERVLGVSLRAPDAVAEGAL